MDTAHSEMPTVLMPIKANFAEAILNGTKKWELRRRAPRIETPFRVMLAVSGTDGQLWGEFICDKICQLTPKEARAIIDECGITMRELYGYLRGSYHLNFIHVTEPKWYVSVEGEHQYPNIRQFGYARTPQTWLYLKKEAGA